MQRKRASSSGEIATLLTIISMLVIGFGISLGNDLTNSAVNRTTEASDNSGSIFQRLLKKTTVTTPDGAPAPSSTTPTPTPIDKDPKSIWFERESPQVCAAGFACVYDPIIRKVELRKPNGDVIIELDQAINSNYIVDPGGRDKKLTPYGITIDKCPNRVKGLSVEFNPDVIAQYYRESNQSPIKSLLVNRDGTRIIEPEDVIIFSTTSNTVPPTLHFIYRKPAGYIFGSEPVTLYFEYDAQIAGVRQRYSQTVEALPGCVKPTPTPSPTPSEGPSPTPSPTPTNTPTPTDGPSPTPSPTPTEGPTPTSSPTPTPTPPAVSCSFKSLAFVQECTEWEDKNRGICKKDSRGFNIGKPVVEPQFRLESNVPQHDLESPLWNITNNKNQSTRVSYNSNLKDQFNKPFSGTYVQVDEFDPAGWNSDADIRVKIDTKRYQFLPKNEGKEIRKSVPVAASDRFKSPANAEVQDTIHGLKVACNQDIEYGWTLQRCENTFDYVFVLDTSTSMTRFDDPFYGKRKIDVLKDNMDLVLTDIGADFHTTGTNSRVAIVQFNRTALTLRDFNTDFNDMKKVVSTGLQLAEGTCIECGLSEASRLIQNRPDKSRTPVVIFLTDGLPNSIPGGPHPREGYEPLINRQVENLKLNAGITIAAIGYGNPSLASSGPNDLPGAQLFDIIKKIATDETWAFSTDTSKASASGTINSIYSRITSRLNSCAKTNDFIAAVQRSADINDDGFVNTNDLTLLFVAYFKQGNELPEDINNDGVVNAIDASVVIENIGIQVKQ